MREAAERLAVLLAALPSLSTVAFAGSTNTNFVKISDASTLDDWKLFFGSKTDNTAEAGGVWMDKSVFTDASAFTGLTDAYGDSIIPEPPKPQTGDNSNLSLWTALLFVSGTAFGFAAFGKKETEQEN